MERQLGRITAKLAAAGLPSGLGPVLADDELTAFEAEHGIELPSAYREFTLLLGHGGAGPGHGLTTLKDAEADVFDSFSGFLAAPSPFTPGGHYSAEWWESFWGPEPECRPDPLQGTVPVADHGCAFETRLVVSGPGHGCLVNVDRDGGSPYVLDDHGFLDWYERWLDERAAGCAMSFFGKKLPGGEAELVEALREARLPQRRARAAHSLLCLPRSALGPAGIEALLAAADDPEPAVRIAALASLRAMRTAEAAPAGRRALDAADPELRSEAVQMLGALGAPDAPAAARQLRADPDRMVRWYALRVLMDLGELTVADVAVLLASGDARTRESAVWALPVARGEGAAALALRASEDGDPAVRREAAVAAGKLADPEPRPAPAFRPGRPEDGSK